MNVSPPAPVAEPVIFCECGRPADIQIVVENRATIFSCQEHGWVASMLVSATIGEEHAGSHNSPADAASREPWVVATDLPESPTEDVRSDLPGPSDAKEIKGEDASVPGSAEHQG